MLVIAAGNFFHLLMIEIRMIKETKNDLNRHKLTRAPETHENTVLHGREQFIALY